MVTDPAQTLRVIEGLALRAETDSDLHRAMERLSVFDLVRLIRAIYYVNQGERA